MTDSIYVGGDQRTTVERFSVFDHAEQVVTSAYEQYEQSHSEPEQFEHDPTEIGEGIATTMTETTRHDKEQMYSLYRESSATGGS